jgi:pimeloyl-ACP methyl ester carboxylesterase
MRRSLFVLGLVAALLAHNALAAGAEVHTRTVTRGTTSLVYLDQGSGPAVVMIPSLGRGAADFDDLAAHVAKAGFRVLRLQPRGVGGSVGPMTGLTLRDLAADVVNVMNAAGVDRAVVLGHDDGNRIARATAAYFPARVRAVILVRAGGKAPPDPVALAALRATFDASLSPSAHIKDVETAFFAPGNDPSAWRGGWYKATADMEHAAVAATPLTDWWGAGSAPLLVVQADQDRIAPAANAALLKADVGARAVVVHIDHAGHALLPEQPRRLAEVIVSYLDGLK